VLFNLEFEGHPVSVNKAYSTARFGGHRFRSQDYAAFKKRVELLVGAKRIAVTRGALSVEIDLHAPDWFTKGGFVRKKDLANFEKTLVDCVFTALGLHDALIFELRMRKVVGPTQKTALRIFDLGAF